MCSTSSSGGSSYDPGDGEPYNSRERAFTAQIGSAAGWLHAGRPRREATRLAFRLHLRRGTAQVVVAAAALARALAERAGDYRDTLFPDQTYLQHAQPSTVGHYLLSFAYPVIRDGRRLLGQLRLPRDPGSGERQDRWAPGDDLLVAQAVLAGLGQDA